MKKWTAAISLLLLTIGASIASSSLASTGTSRSFVRRCESSVSGSLGDDWRRRSIVGGPVAFVGARDFRDAPDRFFRRHPDGYEIQKILALVDNGPDAIVRVARPDRRHAALVYDPALFNRRLWIREADREVIFDACRDVLENPHRRERAQFNGGLVVAGSRCVTLNILNAERVRIDRVTISFGAGRCG